MSAFIVEDKTINTIVTFFSSNRDSNWYKRKFKELGFDLETIAGKEKLGSAMFELNIKAVTQRYSGRAEDFRPLDYKFKFQPHYIRATVLKALQCWLYQCTEGDAFETDLFKTLDHFKGEIACDIVRNMKEYETASWG